MRDAGLSPRIMIDTSHGNSEKDWRRQPLVARDIGEQVAQGDPSIVGVMMESFLVEGRQDVAARVRAHVWPEHHRRVPGLGCDTTRAARARRGRAGAPPRQPLAGDRAKQAAAPGDRVDGAAVLAKRVSPGSPRVARSTVAATALGAQAGAGGHGIFMASRRRRRS